MPILLLQLVRACVTEYSHPAPPFCPVRCEKIANRSTRCPVPASRTWQWRTSSWLVALPDMCRGVLVGLGTRRERVRPPAAGRRQQEEVKEARGEDQMETPKNYQ